MPLSELHQKQKRKNFILLFILFGVVAFFFVLGIIKMKAGA